MLSNVLLQVTTAVEKGMKIKLIHEQNPELGGCEFSDILKVGFAVVALPNGPPLWRSNCYARAVPAFPSLAVWSI